MTISNTDIELVMSKVYNEIDEFGLPTKLHLELSIDKGQIIANALGADANIVKLGTALMDLKLGQAFKEKRLNEHVEMSVLESKNLLKDTNIEETSIQTILNSVEAHHGTVEFETLESEIVANADCYRFLHPRGVFHYFTTLGKRGLSIEETLNQVESKIDEKWAILSLDYCKSELEPYYKSFKKMIEAAR